MSDRNNGDISGVLLEQPSLKDFSSGIRSARVRLRSTGPGFDGKPGKEVEIELTAWGEVAEEASRIPAGSRVFCSYKLGSRASKPREDGSVFLNLTASITSIVALMPSLQRTDHLPPSDQAPASSAGTIPGSDDIPF